MKSRKRRWMIWGLVFILLAGQLSYSGATGLDEAQENIDRLQEEKKRAEERLKELQNQKEDAEQYIASIDAEIAEVIDRLNELSDEVFRTRQELDETSAALSLAIQDEEQQYADMKLRIQYMYERGDTAYIELLFSSENLSDFLNHAEYISQISEYDRDMLYGYQAVVQEIARREQELKEYQLVLEEQQQELKENQEDLELLADAKTEELKQLNQDISEVHDEVIDYDEALKAEEEEFIRIQEEIRRQEELKRQQEEEEKKNNPPAEEVPNGSGNQQEPNSPEVPSERPSSGLIWPVDCSRITSYFGYRVDPITGEPDGTLSNHKGIDIALPGGALRGAPVYAAAGGTVVISRYSESAGQWIILYHGDGLYTVYMHCDARYVSEGETVSQGQVIGIVGNTGWSTAAHLHFEVRVGGFANSSYSVDPLGYVSP